MARGAAREERCGLNGYREDFTLIKEQVAYFLDKNESPPTFIVALGDQYDRTPFILTVEQSF